MSLPKGYAQGTHRMVAPEQTLSRITPHLGSFGITRCADVTGLDQIGIPTYAVVRPSSRTVQVSNGKGLRRVDAKVSGLMEAIELHHAEHPDTPFRRDCLLGLAGTGARSVDPRTLPGFEDHVHFDDRCVVEWTIGEDLLRQEQVWIPAAAAY